MRMLNQPIRVTLLLLALITVAAGGLPAALTSPASAGPATDETHAAPIPSYEPLTPLASEAGAIELEQGEQQGDVTVDVEVTQIFRAGDLVTYTYRFENVSNQTQNNVRLDARFSDFGISRDPRRQTRQFCEENGPIIPCGLVAGSVQTSGGATVEYSGIIQVGSTPVGLRFNLGNLPPGARGSFQVALETGFTFYPRNGGKQETIAGTGEIYVGDKRISLKNRDTFPRGPIFILSKRVVESPSLSRDQPSIFPEEAVTFEIVLGNANTDATRTRADATEATTITLRDELPRGSEFISPTQVLFPYEYRAEENVILWQIPRLRVGEEVVIPVTFRMLDTRAECRALNNRNISVTSPQMPLDDRIAGTPEFPHLFEAGTGASVNVQVPLRVAISSNPRAVAPGDRATLTLEVSNFFPREVRGVQLVYDIQPGAYYITNTASLPRSITTMPRTDQPAQRIVWTFDISGTQSLRSPTKLSFALTISTTATLPDRGTATLIIPESADVPSECIASVPGGVRINVPVDTIVVTKRTDLPQERYIGNVALVDQGEEVTFLIEIENRSDRAIGGFSVTDQLPEHSTESVEAKKPDGSARSKILNDTIEPRPADISTEGGGVIFWNNLNLPARETVVLRYKVSVGGLEYFTYCNVAQGALPAGTQGFQVDNRPGIECIKINPEIEMIKTSDKEAALPGEEIRFSLRLQNNTGITQTVGIVDSFVPGDFEFLRVDPSQTYGNPPRIELIEKGPTLVEWDQVQLPPSGRLDAAFFARIPPGDCVVRRDAYTNRLVMRYRSAVSPSTPPYLVTRLPDTNSKVQIKCVRRTLEFTIRAAQNNPSLETTFPYQLEIKNTNVVEPARNVRVQQLLPLGFRYDSPSTTGNMQERPTETTLPNGRVQLTWVIPEIAPNTPFRIQYNVRAGQSVGPQTTEMRVFPAEATWTADCPAMRAACVMGDDTVKYGTAVVNVLALLTATPNLVIPNRCLDIGEPLSYVVSLVNADSSRNYDDATVVLTLSLGLQYVGVLTNTVPTPVRRLGSNGQTVLTWENLTVQRPRAGQQTQLDLGIGLQVGSVLGRLPTSVEVRTPDGLVPLKEGEVDPNVNVCDGSVRNLTVLKEVNPRRAQPGGEFVYLITLGNDNAGAVNVTSVREQLPAKFTFVEMMPESGITQAPTISGNRLEWRRIPVPRKEGDVPGRTEIRFRVRVERDAELATYISNTNVAGTTPTVPIEYIGQDAEIRIAYENEIYLPLIVRR